MEQDILLCRLIYLAKFINTLPITTLFFFLFIHQPNKKMKRKDKIIKYIFIVKLIFFFSSKIEIIF
jgi:hypothetical protein